MQHHALWETTQEGMDLPTLVKHVTTRQLVKYAGASGDFYEIHYDKDFALEAGLPNVIVHGALKSAFLGQLITDWIGAEGTLKKLGCQYRGMDQPNSPLICRGIVARKYIQNHEHLVDCEIWIEDLQGNKNTSGWATVAIPRTSGHQ